MNRTLILSLLLTFFSLHAGAEDPNPAPNKVTLEKTITQLKKEIEETATALQNADDAGKQKLKPILASKKADLETAEIRLQLADKPFDQIKEERDALQKRQQELTAVIQDDHSSEQKKTDSAKERVAVEKQMAQYEGELTRRAEARLAVKFGGDLTERTFDSFVKEAEEKSSLKITLDNSLYPSRSGITPKKDATIRDVLNSWALANYADWQIEHGELVIMSADEKWKRDLHTQLQRKVTFEFVDTPLDEAINFLRSVSGMCFILDKRAVADGAPSINLRVTDMTLEAALAWIVRLADLQTSIEHRAIYVYGKNITRKDFDVKGEVISNIGNADPDTAWKAETLRKLSRKVSFEFVDTPLDETIQFLNSMTKVNIIMDARIIQGGLAKNPTTLRVSDMEMYDALYWICTLSGLQWDLTNQAILISPQDQPAQPAAPEVQQIAEPQAGSKLRLKFTNGNLLEAERDALNHSPDIKKAILDQIQDPIQDGLLSYKIDELEISPADIEKTINKLIPNVKVMVDNDQNLAVIMSDDIKHLRQARALIRSFTKKAQVAETQVQAAAAAREKAPEQQAPAAAQKEEPKHDDAPEKPEAPKNIDAVKPPSPPDF